jgi:hypothetical protein
MSVAARKMTCSFQAKEYIGRALGSMKGLKVLLCDDAVRWIMNIAFTQHELLRHEVVLVDMLSNLNRGTMKHMKCVVFCRPSSRNFADITQELTEPSFSEYRLFFTNFISTDQLQGLANADIHDLVSGVEEVFLDVAPLADHMAVILLTTTTGLNTSDDIFCNPVLQSSWNNEYFSIAAQSITAAVLMLKRRPIIRYRTGNRVCERIASDVASRMRSVHQGFPDLKSRDSVLLIVDRLDDPITPLITPWTYEAMIHEFIGFRKGNELTVENGTDPRPEDVHVLTTNGDAFYADHCFSDFGQVCLAVGELVTAYRNKTAALDRNTVSLDDIKNFAAKIGDARKETNQLVRHANIVSQIATDVESRDLTNISVLEQEMVAAYNSQEHSKAILELVKSSKTEIDDALRISILYHLRYEKSGHNVTDQLKAELQLRGCPPHRIALIDRVAEIAGKDYRKHEVFKGSSNTFKAVVTTIAQFGNQVKNVFTQHEPLLKKLILRAYNGLLSEKDYPIQKVPGQADGDGAMQAKDIVIVMVGGATYSEAMLVHQLNSGTVENRVDRGGDTIDSVATKLTGDFTKMVDANITLLSTAVINSKQFLASIM